MSPRSRRRGKGAGGAPRSRRGGGNRAPQRGDGAGFWGDAAKLPEARQEIRITEVPAAVALSLGPPPLHGHEAIAQHYFTVVYDRAVMLAGAVAAAGGMLNPDDLAEPDD